MKKPSSLQERVKLWRLPEMGGVEMMHATYVTQSFPRHSHDGFAVGVIEQGALGFYYHGENVVAAAGSINLANPDEPHTGHAATKAGWTYRMFYFDAGLLQEAAGEWSGTPQDIPFFRPGVINDPPLARAIQALHSNLEEGRTSRLERESGLLGLLTQLIARHAEARPEPAPIRPELRRIRRVCDYIQARYDENLSLSELASLIELSPFHFLRVFSEAIGLPPHAYQSQLRIRKAKALLRSGMHIAATACETGFADQSHFSRCFKRLTGTTPGQYRKIVQDG